MTRSLRIGADIEGCTARASVTSTAVCGGLSHRWAKVPDGEDDDLRNLVEQARHDGSGSEDRDARLRQNTAAEVLYVDGHDCFGARGNRNRGDVTILRIVVRSLDRARIGRSHRLRERGAHPRDGVLDEPGWGLCRGCHR